VRMVVVVVVVGVVVVVVVVVVHGGCEAEVVLDVHLHATCMRRHSSRHVLLLCDMNGRDDSSV